MDRWERRSRTIESAVLQRRGTMRRTLRFVTAAACLLGFQFGIADDKSAVVPWETLAQVSFSKQKDRYTAEFSKQVAALDKREVKLKGFMLPLEQGLAQKRFL